MLAGCPDRPLDRAIALEAQGHLEEAGELYVDVAKKDPANLAAWDHAVELWCRKKVNVGECMNVLDLELDRLGNLERHHDALAEVLELRARARLEQGLLDAALQDLERAERAGPLRPGVHAAKARVLLRAGRRDAALEAIRRARELDPSAVEVEELLRELRATADEGFGGTTTATPTR